MSRMVSVRIVGFEVSGDNSVDIIFQFVGSSKRIRRMVSLTESMNRRYRVGNYLQIPVSDEEFREIFRQTVNPRQALPHPTVPDLTKPRHAQSLCDAAIESSSVWIDTAEAQI